MKRFKMFPVVCLFFLGFHFPLAKSNETASAAEVERLNVVYSSIAGASISTWGPKEAGIYKKYGLDVNLIYVAGPQDLKGKTFGVARFGSLTDLGLQKALSELGLDPAKDIKMIQTGGVPENLLFMQQGVIKGALISSPTLEKAKELGYKELMNLGDLT